MRPSVAVTYAGIVTYWAGIGIDIDIGPDGMIRVARVLLTMKLNVSYTSNYKHEIINR